MKLMARRKSRERASDDAAAAPETTAITLLDGTE
jgi:hypothetical protein